MGAGWWVKPGVVDEPLQQDWLSSSCKPASALQRVSGQNQGILPAGPQVGMGSH